MNNENEEEFLTLVSNDKQTFKIHKDLCMISDYLKNITQLDMNTHIINIDISGNLLKLIVEFMTYYKNQPFDRIQKPVPVDFQCCKFILDDKEEPFDANFYIELLQGNFNLLKLVNIVNYLSIKPMLELICAKIAHKIRNMTTEEELDYLQISREDLTEMKKTNDWAKN